MRSWWKRTRRCAPPAGSSTPAAVASASAASTRAAATEHAGEHVDVAGVRGAITVGECLPLLRQLDPGRAKELRPRPERRGRRQRITAALRDARTGGTSARGKGLPDPRLADARLAREQHELAGAAGGRGQRVVETGQHVGAADEGRSARRLRRRQPQREAAPAHRLDLRPARAARERPARLLHRARDGPVAHVRAFPHRLDQLVTADHPAHPLDQVGQEREDARLQPEALAGAAQLPSFAVQVRRADSATQAVAVNRCVVGAAGSSGSTTSPAWTRGSARSPRTAARRRPMPSWRAAQRSTAAPVPAPASAPTSAASSDPGARPANGAPTRERRPLVAWAWSSRSCSRRSLARGGAVAPQSAEPLAPRLADTRGCWPTRVRAVYVSLDVARGAEP